MAARHNRHTHTRAGRRAAAEQVVARISVPAHADVCVVGGGAAGLVAAIVAAERGARVVVLERDLECGRTILATGNGRCNFANAVLDGGAYRNGDFVRDVCGERWLEDVLGLFASCGMAWAEEAEGRLYPLSRQAASVRNVLLGRARRAGVVALASGREVVEVAGVDSGGNDGGCGDGASRGDAGDGMRWRVTWRDRFGEGREHGLAARSLVLATGGTSRLAERIPSLELVAQQPILCPLGCSGPALTALDGRRVRADVRLLRGGTCVAQERGEVLFRDYGLSGIAVFNLSRHATPGDGIRLDLLPSLDATQAARLGRHTLDGLLDPVVAHALLGETGSAAEALRLAKRLDYRVEGLAQTSSAQVRRGGLAVGQIEASTLEVRQAPGLFACGEALDVDGPCGGYNLAWAWKSGMVAGAAAAKGALR